jgi:hypothetical protein
MLCTLSVMKIEVLEVGSILERRSRRRVEPNQYALTEAITVRPVAAVNWMKGEKRSYENS